MCWITMLLWIALVIALLDFICATVSFFSDNFARKMSRIRRAVIRFTMRWIRFSHVILTAILLRLNRADQREIERYGR